MKNGITLLLIFILVISCSTNEYEETIDANYLKEINDWHSSRLENLKKENGWLNLVGLFWLKEGENTFGSDKSNDIVFPEGKADAKIGKILKNDTLITVIVEENVSVMNNGKSTKSIEMKADITGEPTILDHKSLRWFIIQRDNKYGVRLRDLEAELLSEFDGIERFPVQDKWKIKANFKKYDPPKKIIIPTILGTESEAYSPGQILFNIDNVEYSLEPTGNLKNLFIVFADLTSGEETYGAGRFLYIDGPDSNNNVILDFNKAYNPPCAFTKYATCPLPPNENKLRVRITAGEKNYSAGH